MIYKGAEAEIRVTDYMGKNAVVKQRIPKSYRISEIDSSLITSRTKEESKLIAEARSCGVSVPLLFDINVAQGRIIMQYLKGDRVKDILNTVSEQQRKKICYMIGESVAKLHNNNLIHGDITTSNMILVDNRLHFIDFGLGSKNTELESKGVDLHVLMEALESTHSQHPRCFKYVLQGYTKAFEGNANAVLHKIEDIVRRGRYR